MNISSVGSSYWLYNSSTQGSTSTTGTSASSDPLAALQAKHGKEKGKETAMDSASAASFFNGQMNQGLLSVTTAANQDTMSVSEVSATNENDFAGIMPPPPPVSSQQMGVAAQAYDSNTVYGTTAV